MPTYVYECEACERTFERMRSMADESDEHCPDCGKKAQRIVPDCGKKAQRIVTAGAGILVKGPPPTGCPDGACPSSGKCMGPDARCPGADLGS
ncbi:MAG: FmdB family zinc ribbon protein [Planctomycetota bacterium]|jgi:putative FmdB family regulatory protein